MTGRAIILQADARHLPLPDASVDLIVTSPPYWRQRDYRDGDTSMPGQIGNEPTWQDWLAVMVVCVREWKRVLKPTGNMFINCGDKYTDKGLLGLPWRLLFACTDQVGLILRAEIIWAKPNGLPESVTDRVRRAHEQVFHLVKSPRYYTAIDEIREPSQIVFTAPQNGTSHHARAMAAAEGHHRYDTRTNNPLGKLPGSVWSIPSQPLQVPAHLGVDHYAAFPPALVRPIVLGWSPAGICTACGQGRRPTTTVAPVPTQAWALAQRNGRSWHGDGTDPKRALGVAAADRQRTITGYVCDCWPPKRSGITPSEGFGLIAQARAEAGPPPTRPAIVLDPFGGTGTTALVAHAYGRVGITIDRSADYTRLARWRVHDPAERARALNVPKPPPVAPDQEALFDLT